MNQIHSLLKEKGLTQNDLAKKIGIDKAYLSRIASGKITPTVVTARRLATALDTSIDTLFPAKK